MHEHRIRHLELIQTAIARMAENSAAIKRHAVVVSLAVLGSARVLSESSLLLGGVIVTVVLALLDASYLRNERGFRNLYESVRQEEDFQPVDFRMMPSRAGHPVLHSLCSWSVGGFYLPLVVLQSIAWIVCGESLSASVP